jgi:lysozyme
MSDDAILAIATPLIAGFEGFRANPYQDQKGVWTIGYGATYLANKQKVTATTPPMTQEAATAYLTELVAADLAKVRDMVHVSISNHAMAALCSFSYNLGLTALKTSSLLSALNKNDMAAAANWFASWIHVDGRVDRGLVNRRAKEAAVFLTPDDDQPLSQVVANKPVEDEADMLDAKYNVT